MQIQENFSIKFLWPNFSCDNCKTWKLWQNGNFSINWNSKNYISAVFKLLPHFPLLVGLRFCCNGKWVIHMVEMFFSLFRYQKHEECAKILLHEILNFFYYFTCWQEVLCMKYVNRSECKEIDVFFKCCGNLAAYWRISLKLIFPLFSVTWQLHTNEYFLL